MAGPCDALTLCRSQLPRHSLQGNGGLISLAFVDALQRAVKQSIKVKLLHHLKVADESSLKLVHYVRA